MKIKGIRNRATRVTSILVVGVITIGLLAFLPTTAAHAQDVGSSTVEFIQPVKNYPFLEKAYQTVQTTLSNLGNVISKASAGSDKVLDLINKGNGAGLNTSTLQVALSNFESAISAAQASSNTASGILSSHAGFDGSGKVTDPRAAMRTIVDAASALKNGASSLKGAGESLRSTVTKWINVNKEIIVEERLETAFQKEKDTLEKLNGYLAKSEGAFARVQALIDKGSAAGLDISSLSIAQSDFLSSISTAQSSYDTAVGILGTHEGFDEQGNVTDSAAAKQTLKDAGNAMKSAGTTLRDAGSILKVTVTSWLEANKTIFDDRLSERFQNANSWLSVQAINIGKLQDAASKLSAFIEQAKGDGLDTSSLEVVLTHMNSQIPQSQASHDAAASILATHTGFDDSGNVTDEALARQMLESARTNLDASRSINGSLASELKVTIEAWKAAHPSETLSIDTDSINR